MSSEIQVHEFEATVEDNKITLHEDPRGSDIQPYEIEPDTVRMETIDLLVKMLRENRLKDIEEYKVLGANLYSVLFDNDIGEAINNAYYEDKRAAYLLVKLSFKGRGQEYLSSLPWEYLYRPKRPGKIGSGFLAEVSKLVLVRNLHLNITPTPIQISDDELPLRILFVAPSPRDEDRVEYARILEEINAIEEESEGRIRVYQLVEPEEPGEAPVVTFDEFKDWVTSSDPHIIHFVGHGKYEPGKGGEIAFMRSDYDADWREDSRFAGVLAESPRLRLVFLQACESALPNPYQALSGVAMELAHRNIPAVVAMQYKVKQHIASQFAQVFYHSLKDNHTIEYAVQQGRREIADELQGSLAFGLPVLYMRESGALMKMGALPTTTEEKPQERARGRSSPGLAIAGETEIVEVICPWCGTSNRPDANFCYQCLRPLKCKYCEHPVRRAGIGCDNCGKPFAETETQPVEIAGAKRGRQDDRPAETKRDTRAASRGGRQDDHKAGSQP